MHTHTSFCDGSGAVEDFCEAAYKKKFVSLGFSAHAPIAKKTGIKTDWHLDDGRLGEYRSAVNDARTRWRGRLDVYLGLEADYIDGLVSPSDFDYAELGLDYLIGSVHYIKPPRCADSPPEEFEKLVNEDFGGDAAALVDRYWDFMELMISGGGFDIIAHADLIKKNNKYDKWFSPNDERYVKRLERIACVIAESGLVTEVNTGGLNRGYTVEPYPSLRLLRLLQKKGAPVMINADAHEPDHLGGFYAEARRLLLEAGFTRHCLFQGRIDGKARWKTEPL
jgi:histidinol-phosphatase (PHP family)